MSKITTSEIRAHSEGLDMKNLTISDMPSNILLAVFYFLLAYSALTSHALFGTPNEIGSFVVGLLLGGCGFYMLIGKATGNYFKAAAFPIMLYLGLFTGIAIYNGRGIGGIEFVSWMNIIFVYRDWDADARKRSLEMFAAEQVNKIAQMQVELDKLKPANGE